MWYNNRKGKIYKDAGKKVSSMTNAEIREFKSFVKDVLIKQYNMNEVEAHRAVRNSYLSEALRRDKGYVEHDTVEEWAEYIHKEVTNSALLMM